MGRSRHAEELKALSRVAGGRLPEGFPAGQWALPSGGWRASRAGESPSPCCDASGPGTRHPSAWACRRTVPRRDRCQRRLVALFKSR